MDHEEYAALLDAFLDGELSGEDAARVQAHLETCETCRAYLDDALAIRAAFPSVEDTEVPEGFGIAVMAALPERRRTVRFPLWARAAVPLAAAVALVLILRGFGGPMAGGGAAGADETMERSLPEEASGSAEARSGDTEEPPQSAEIYTLQSGGSPDADGGPESPEPPEPETYRTAQSADSTSDAPAEDSGTTEAAPSDFARQNSTASAAASAPASAPQAGGGTNEAAQEAAAEVEEADASETDEPEAVLIALPPEAAPLLDAWTPLLTADDGNWYAFPDGDAFRALLKAVAAAGLQPSADAPDLIPAGITAPYLIFLHTSD